MFDKTLCLFHLMLIQLICILNNRNISPNTCTLPMTNLISELNIDTVI